MVKGVTIDDDDSSDDEARFLSLGRTGDVRRVDANDDDDAGSDDDAAPAMEEDSDDDAAPAMDADSEDDDERYEHKSRYEANDGDDSGDDAVGATGAGMGAAISKILRKDVAGDPVLAKRKTPLMKEFESDKEARQRQKRRRLEREQRRAVGAYAAPEAERVVRERGLKKTASRAVVALFNAIAKHQHPKAGAAPDAAPKAPKQKRVRPSQNGPAADVREAAAEAVEQTVARDALANDWTNSDYLLDAKPGAWDDDEPAPAPAKKKGPKKDDDKPHAFLYGKTSRQMR
jgi:hypothetical protein